MNVGVRPHSWPHEQSANETVFMEGLSGPADRREIKIGKGMGQLPVPALSWLWGTQQVSDQYRIGEF